MDLVVECYKCTRDFPKQETFGLASQLQRAIVSIPSNIAEGNERGNPKEFLHYLRIASGSLAEAETQIEISFRLNYRDQKVRDSLLTNCEEVGRMLGGLRKNIQRKIDSL